MSGLCDLKVAVLGNKNVGKATVLYALLGRNFGGIVNTKTVVGAKPDVITIEAVVAMASGEKENGYASVIGEKPIELKDGVKVNEITYRAEIPSPIVPMRQGTDFVFSIIPPPLEGEEYKNVLIEKWESFDAIIFVIDTKKGVTDDDIEYLTTIHGQQLKTRQIPVFVLCNKVDDKDNEKIAKHLKKAKSKVKKVFQVEDNGTEKEDDAASCLEPLVCSIQAQKALTFRAGCKMTVYDFEDFDKDLMTLIGKEKFGKDEWKAMSHEDRFRYTHEHLVGKKSHKEGMSMCGFDKVMKNFEAFLGGEEQQQKLLQTRVDGILNSIRPFQSDWISYSLFTAYNRLSALSSGDDKKEELEERSAKMRSLFWDTFDEYQKGTFLKFMNAFPDKIKVVADPLQELQYYHKLVEVANWRGEEEVILERQKALVQQYLSFLKAKESETLGSSEWDPKSSMSPFDWCSVNQSILLLAYDPYFCENFGKFKIAADDCVFKARMWQATKLTSIPEVCPYCIETLDLTKQKPAHHRCKPCNKVFVDGPFTDTMPCGYCGAADVGPTNAKCENCKYEHEPLVRVAEWHKTTNDDQGLVGPVHGDLFSKIIHVSVPEKLSDPEHFGHPIFKASAFSKVIEDSKLKRLKAIEMS